MLTMIQQGWLATYPLILMSIVSLTVIAERLFSFRNLIGQTADLTRGVHADLTKASRRLRSNVPRPRAVSRPAASSPS